MTQQQEFDKFVKNVSWYLNANSSWTAVYSTPRFNFSYAGTPNYSRKKVQSEVLEGLFRTVKEYCESHNLDLFN